MKSKSFKQTKKPREFVIWTDSKGNNPLELDQCELFELFVFVT